MALGMGKKAIKKLGVLAHDEVRKQLYRLTNVGQAEIAAHGEVKAVAYAVGIDNDARRRLLN
jgi:hypothetical protein